ncbi:histone acetyltransferase subunit 3 [Cordyceps militaris]|uniref:Histone acetyltransferase subunit 3 n=1 Tax=Cordyceps militaris TaxID=73501 RepID=A0A2H4SJP5_CORMI|nr:histone acetyltransferase subunit 3 [Cordyceps militaris]
MAPGSSQKGTSKKNAAMQKQSRNSTPAPTATSSLPPSEFYDPDYLNTRVILFANLSYDDLVDHGASNATVPDSKTVDGMLEKLKSLTNIMEKRSTFYDRGMRHLADERKNRPDDFDRMHADGENEGKKSKQKRKKGDGHDGDQSSPVRDSKQRHTRGGSGSSSLSPNAAGSPSAMDVDKKAKKEKKEKDGEGGEEDESSSEDEGAPPKREMPAAQTFGEDPSTFPDPTVYEIRDVYPGMPEKLRKEIYSVAVYPPSDLADLIAGDPPDKDFSNAKPSSQINFTTFNTYIEPFFRPFSEEDLAFLRERGDRASPFVMPKRGKRHYTEIWSDEDGSMSVDSPQQGRDKLSPNVSRGTIENMNDAVAETDGLSIGPLASRLLQALRPENRQQATEEKVGANGVNGDVSMNGDGDDHGPVSDDKSLAPATYMAESSTDAWKKAVHPKLEYTQVEERLKQELRHIGFLPPEGDADYDGHFDDEVAARLRVLQTRLKEQMLINGARKARLTDLVRERMAHQEYQTILEDLDSQVQAAYLKRTRTMGKSKKAKRPGGAGGGSHAAGGAAGMARPGIGDLTKTLMERRRRWIDTIGSVFEDESVRKVPRVEDEGSSIFKSSMMADLIKKEKEQWDEDIEEE